jgi:hypothetical protein
MAFGQSTDRRVARHLPDRIQVLRQQKRVAPQARSGRRGFDTRVPAANYDDIKFLRIQPHEAGILRLFSGRRKWSRR